MPYGPTLTPIDYGVSSVPANTPLDIKAAVGTSTNPATTGTKPIVGVGFRPKVLLPFWSGYIEGVHSIAAHSFGCGLSATNRAHISVVSRDAASTSATNRRHDNLNIIDLLDTNGNLFINADLESLDADGFTIDWTTVGNSTARILNHICLGGDDLEVSLTQHQMNGTNAPQSFPHGLSGGAPTALLAFSAINPISPPNTSETLSVSIGGYAGASHFNASIVAANSVTTTFTKRRLSNSVLLSWIGSVSGSIDRAIAVSSVDSTNVHCTYPVTTGAGQSYFWMLAIRGAKAQVGTFDCNGSTDPLTIACSGITPKLFLPVFVPAGVTNVGTVQNSLLLSIGASDGLNNVSCGITDKNGQATTSSRRFQSSDSLIEYSVDGSLRFEASAAFSDEAVVITPTTAQAAYGQGGYLILGA